MKKQKQIRVDKQPVAYNGHIHTRKTKNGAFTTIAANGDFQRFYECLCEHLAGNQWNLIPVFKRELRTFSNTSEGRIYSKLCPSIEIDSPEMCYLIILPSVSGYVELYKIGVYNRGMGIGSSIMRVLNEASRQTGIKIRLIPGDPSTNMAFSTPQHSRMRRDFYHKNGFKRETSSLYWSNESLLSTHLSDITESVSKK